MKKKGLLALGLMTAVLALSSCDSMPKEIKLEDVKEEILYMRDDGSGQIAYVEDFKEDYLNLDELKGYINAELAAYNKQFGEKAAELSNIEVSAGKVRAVLTFKSADVYTAFNEKKGENNVRFLNSKEALTEFGEIAFDEADSKENVKRAADEVLTDDYNIAVVEGSMLFQSKNKIKYFAGGTLLDVHHIRVDEGCKAVVVYSK